MRTRLEDARVDLQPRLEVLLREDGLAGGDPPDERQADLLAHGVLQLDSPGGAGHQCDDALAGERPQVLLGRIGGAEAKFTSDLGPGRGHARFRR